MANNFIFLTEGNAGLKSCKPQMFTTFVTSQLNRQGVPGTVVQRAVVFDNETGDKNTAVPSVRHVFWVFHHQFILFISNSLHLLIEYVPFWLLPKIRDLVSIAIVDRSHQITKREVGKCPLMQLLYPPKFLLFS
jgi:hypothetical protein